MFETLLWVGFVAAVPVLNVGYNQVTLFVAVKGFGYQYRKRDMFWFYAAFLVPVAAAVALVSSVRVPVQFRPAVAIAFPVGVTLYHFDNRVWAWWADASLSPPGMSVVSVLPALFLPVAEEFLYRGLLGASLLEYGVVPYVTVSAVLFGLNHYYLGRKEIAFKTWDGVVYCVLFLWGGFLAPVAAHVGYNAAQVRFVTAGA
ncbi:MAG: CPBP family intramembrane glutamic endopeptidase [Haloarcula sp.]